METAEFAGLKNWFNTYVAGVYGDSAYIDANLKLKEEHCKRTEDEMLYLAKSLKLNESDTLLAQALGMLHDVGRFEQFIVYQTYNDSKSSSHGKLGIKVLRENFVLQGLEQMEMSIIETAVEYHGFKDLPEGLSGKRLQFTKMIRDADKIDIFAVVIDNFKKFQEAPDKYPLEIEFPLTGGCSPEVLSGVAMGKPVDYRLLKNMDDFRLLQLGWVYDINYAASLKRMKERGHLQTIADMLPQTPEVKSVVAAIFAYVDQRSAEL